jgi:FkbM family methyltransferase
MWRRIRKHRAYRHARKRLRRYTPRDRFFGRAQRFVPYLGVELDGIRYVLSSSDRNVGRSLVVKRDRKELRELARALDLLQAHGIGTGRRIMLDVGANIGTTVLPAMLTHGFERALAFEPEETNYRLLRANVAMNELDDRVRTYRVALSDTTGAGVLDVSSSNAGSYWLTSDGDGEAVRLARLDDVLRDAEVAADTVDLLWMDVEGHEPHVLAGAPGLLAAGAPTVLEVCPRLLDRSGGLALLLDQLRSSFTHVYDLRRPNVGATDVASIESLVDLYAASFTDLLAFRSPAR